MSFQALLDRCKAHPVIAGIAAVGAVLGFVVKKTCEWMRICSSDVSSKPSRLYSRKTGPMSNRSPSSDRLSSSPCIRPTHFWTPETN